jgi:hypothetical protein
MCLQEKISAARRRSQASWIRRWIEEPRPSDGYYSTSALRLLAADFIA